MSDDKKIIFSMVNVNKQTPEGKQILKNIYVQHLNQNISQLRIIRWHRLIISLSATSPRGNFLT